MTQSKKIMKKWNKIPGKVFAATAAAMLAMVFAVSPACAQMKSQERTESDVRNINQRPSVLQQVGIDQNLGASLPLDAKFKDENDKTVAIGDYFNHKRPVLLALVYYDCTMLCTQVLNGTMSALNVLKFDAGKDFDVIALSFDPRETPELAKEKKKTYLERYRRAGAEQGVHFLTGEKAQIDRVTQATGFRYQWDDRTSQFAHASALILVTPEGRIAQYYNGIEYSPKDMRLGIIEASQEHLGTLVDKVVLYCYHYDPMTGKYGALTMRILRLCAVATVLILGSFMAISFRRDSRLSRENKKLEDAMSDGGRI
jgi:protein SCO1/2